MKKEPPDDFSACPNCGGLVVYRGVGRRPVWCSTRCRNEASLARYAARRAGVEVKVVEVVRTQTENAEPRAHAAQPAASAKPDQASTGSVGVPKPTREQALRVVRNDPAAIGQLLAYLERRRLEGDIATPDWLPVRNALRLIARGLEPDLERP